MTLGIGIGRCQPVDPSWECLRGRLAAIVTEHRYLSSLRVVLVGFILPLQPNDVGTDVDDLVEDA